MRTIGIRGLAIAVAVLSASCASATKRYEQGQELEQQGRVADAAQRYVDALKKDPALVEARQRLLETGTRAIATAVQEANVLTASGAHADAADVLRRADEIIHDAAGVGVILPTPNGYAEQRSLTLDRAVDQALAQATTAAMRGDYAESVRLVERAEERWEPRPDRQAALNRGLYDAQLAWGQREASNGRFRSAYAHGESAAAVPGVDRSAINALQTDALRRGTILVAVFATVARAGTDNRLLPELNDLLALDHWQRPPQWIEMVNTIEAQRVVRNRGLAGRDLDVPNASALARQFGARYAVALTLDSVRYSESKVERRRKPARTRAGADTAFFVEEGQLELWARASWRTIAANAGRGVVDRGDASDHASTNFRRATYVGDWHDLELSSTDRAMFEQRDARDTQDMLRKVARGLSGRIGRDVFDALLRRVD
jgi:tetratricopeptide (TPR) repeat protein